MDEQQLLNYLEEYNTYKEATDELNTAIIHEFDPKFNIYPIYDQRDVYWQIKDKFWLVYSLNPEDIDEDCDKTDWSEIEKVKGHSDNLTLIQLISGDEFIYCILDNAMEIKE
jgi:hypothetical protein